MLPFACGTCAAKLTDAAIQKTAQTNEKSISAMGRYVAVKNLASSHDLPLAYTTRIPASKMSAPTATKIKKTYLRARTSRLSRPRSPGNAAHESFSRAGCALQFSLPPSL